ncbi:hypothetical protein J6590_009591 [Homalodisca vitripennis]|nr:hypothetical protein J6590_009591 [Homalodisca vitripennis]
MRILDGDDPRAQCRPIFVKLRILTVVPTAERSETLAFESELEIAQYHRPCTVSTLPLILLDKILAQASGP